MKTLSVNRRTLLKTGTAAAAGAAAVAAFGGLRPAWAQDTHLRLLWWGSQERADRTFRATDLYMQTHEGVNIDGETIGWQDYWTRLATQVAGRNAPDILQMDYRYIFEYARRDALAPLDELMPDTLDLGSFNQAQVDSGKVDGNIYGVSLGANSTAMMVNADAWGEVGMDPPTRSTTWAELGEMGAELTKATSRDRYWGLSDGSGLEPALENWLRQRGKALYTEDGQLAYDAEDLREWWEMWAEMREMGACVPPDVQALDQYQIETAMVSVGRAALSYAHSNQLVGFQGVNPDRIVLNNYPLAEAGSTGGHYRKPSMFFSIAAQSENREAAAAYINFFVNDIEAARIIGVERGVPESSEIREQLAAELSEVDKMAVEYVGGLGDLAGPLPPPPPAGAGEADFALRRVSEEVGFGQHTPASGAEAYVEEAAAILARG